MEMGASRRTRALEKIRCPSEITEPDDRPAQQQCNHFSIRKLRSLSQIFCDQQCDEEQSKNLCPISRKQFRRWNCSNCLKEVQNEGHGTTSRTVSLNQDACSISLVRTFMPNSFARRLFPCAQQPSQGNTVGRSTPLKCWQESNLKCVLPSSSNKGVTQANIYPAMKDLQASPSNHDVDSYRNVSGVAKQILGNSNIHSGGDQLYNKVQHEATSNTDDISYVKVYQRRSGKKRLLSEISDSDQQDSGGNREHSEMRTSSVPHIRRGSQPQLCISGDQVGAAALVSAKFLRVFAGSFSSKLYLPRGGTGASGPMPAGKLIVIADSGVEYSVEVCITRRNRAVLQDGWHQVVHGERITMGQLAMFERGANNTLTMKLFGPDGVCQALGPTGSSFIIKELLGEPRGIMHLPPRYCMDVIGKRVYALSEGGTQYCLLVGVVNGSLAFTDGWEALMDREGINNTDSVAFVRSASMTMRFVVFNHRGVKKEERGRCSGHPMTVGLDVGPTPSCKWFFGPGVEEGGETINVMHAIRMSSAKDTLLYAASLQSNQMGKTGMHFSEEFSKQLPDETTPLKLRFNSSAVILRGFLTKDGSKISRITKGWAAFAKEHLLAAGTIYVFKFRTARKGWALNVVQVLV